jgi:hypothetical protein
VVVKVCEQRMKYQSRYPIESSVCECHTTITAMSLSQVDLGVGERGGELEGVKDERESQVWCGPVIIPSLRLVCALVGDCRRCNAGA